LSWQHLYHVKPGLRRGIWTQYICIHEYLILIEKLIYLIINHLCQSCLSTTPEGPSWSWSYCGWIYNYLCNQCLSPLTNPRSWRGVLDRKVCDKVCLWLAAGRWFSPVSSTNKTDRHDITEISLKVALNTITKPSMASVNRLNHRYIRFVNTFEITAFLICHYRGGSRRLFNLFRSH
jgi:hypothetical protein